MNTPEPVHGTYSIYVEASYRLELPTGRAPADGWPLLVALHCKGDTGERLAERFRVSEPLPYARLFPSGPVPMILGEAGKGCSVGRSWYSYTGDPDALQEELCRAESILLECVDQVAGHHDVDARRVVALGHSQGGYLASYTALRHRDRFAGLVAVSCRIKHEVLGPELAAAAGYPVLGIHGEKDQSVLPGPQKEAFEVLRRHRLDAVLHLHRGGHGIRRSTLPIIDAFVRRVLGLG